MWQTLGISGEELIHSGEVIFAVAVEEILEFPVEFVQMASDEDFDAGVQQSGGERRR